MVDKETYNIVDVVNQAEAKIKPFGLNLNSHQRQISEMYLKKGWIRCDDYIDLEKIFWNTFTKKARAGSNETPRVIKAARIVGLLLSRGFSNHLPNASKPVLIRDDESGAYRMPATRFIDLTELTNALKGRSIQTRASRDLGVSGVRSRDSCKQGKVPLEEDSNHFSSSSPDQLHLVLLLQVPSSFWTTYLSPRFFSLDSQLVTCPIHHPVNHPLTFFILSTQCQYFFDNQFFNQFLAAISNPNVPFNYSGPFFCNICGGPPTSRGLLKHSTFRGFDQVDEDFDLDRDLLMDYYGEGPVSDNGVGRRPGRREEV